MTSFVLRREGPPPEDATQAVAGEGVLYYALPIKAGAPLRVVESLDDAFIFESKQNAQNVLDADARLKGFKVAEVK